MCFIIEYWNYWDFRHKLHKTAALIEIPCVENSCSVQTIILGGVITGTTGEYDFIKNQINQVDNTEMAEQIRMPFGGTLVWVLVFVMPHTTLYYCLACSANL